LLVNLKKMVAKMKNSFLFNLISGIVLIIFAILIIPTLAGFDNQPEFIWLFALFFLVIGIVSFLIGYFKKR